MSEQAGPYSVDGGGVMRTVDDPQRPGLTEWTCREWTCRDPRNMSPPKLATLLNAAFAAGAASTPRPAGEAGQPNCPTCGTNKHVTPCVVPGLPWQCGHGKSGVTDVTQFRYTKFDPPPAALQPPSGTGGQAVQAVIDAARRCVPKDETVHLVDLWGRLDALRAALDALAALASLSTGGAAEGGKDARV